MKADPCACMESARVCMAFMSSHYLDFSSSGFRQITYSSSNHIEVYIYCSSTGAAVYIIVSSYCYSYFIIILFSYIIMSKHNKTTSS